MILSIYMGIIAILIYVILGIVLFSHEAKLKLPGLHHLESRIYASRKQAQIIHLVPSLMGIFSFLNLYDETELLKSEMSILFVFQFICILLILPFAMVYIYFAPEPQKHKVEQI